MLWAITVYLVRQKKPYVITLIPALFMTVVCTTYLFSAQLFKLEGSTTAIIAVGALLVALVWFVTWYRKETTKTNKE
jgi:carbon starvation protein CstA